MAKRKSVFGWYACMECGRIIDFKANEKMWTCKTEGCPNSKGKHDLFECGFLAMDEEKESEVKDI